jgi:hypothetical protein
MSTKRRPKSPHHWPREHGAWAQLAIPLVAALLLGQPSLDAALLALSAVALFAAHEPLLVWRGLRGLRLQAQEGALAKRHLLQRLLVAAIAGLTALTHGSQTLLIAVVCVIPLGILQLALTLTDRHKSLPGEWLAGGALAAAAVPVALAAHVSIPDALRHALTWAGGFGVMTTAVHACKARALLQPRRARLIALAIVLAIAGLVVAALRSEWRPLAPMALAALLLALVPIRLRFMARVGWLLAVASLAALALQLAVTR